MRDRTDEQKETKVTKGLTYNLLFPYRPPKKMLFNAAGSQELDPPSATPTSRVRVLRRRPPTAVISRARHPIPDLKSLFPSLPSVKIFGDASSR
jgi:hypothetical protein